LLSGEFQRSLGGHDAFAGFARHFDRVKGLDHLNQILYVDFKTWLPNDILVKVDRMTMANSLEVRSPLLDHRLIELAATMPVSMKYRKGTSKYVVKRYAETRVPSRVIHRPKMGFSIPLASWLRGELRETAQELLLSGRALDRGYYQPDAVRSMWVRHQEGRRNHGRQLWALMVLELWHRLFVDQQLGSAPVIELAGGAGSAATQGPRSSGSVRTAAGAQ
jgi:asparagine synthase (glutamine-hydrolysing)